MSKQTFTPPMPYYEPPDDEAIEKLRNMSKKERKQLEKSTYLKSHLAEQRKRRAKIKRERRTDLWWNKILPVLNTILALIAAITGIIALLR